MVIIITVSRTVNTHLIYLQFVPLQSIRCKIIRLFYDVAVINIIPKTKHSLDLSAIYTFTINRCKVIMAEECPVDLKGMRIKYKNSNEAFTEKDIPIKDPFNQFDIWIKEAINDKSIIEPNAMCLSTATKDGIPSGRFVLLKEYGNKQGFKFFTNSISRKGQELKENPHAALTAYWPSLNRSIRIEGITELLPQKESVEYFSQRPYASQIGALASNQSAPIPSREHLCRKGEEMQKLYPDKKDVIKPSTWNGYKLVPNSLEFWQGQSDRMHDRIRFRKLKLNEKPDGVLLHEGVDGWVYERLAP